MEEEEDTLSMMLSRSMKPSNIEDHSTLRRMGNGRTSATLPAGKQFMNRNISSMITIGGSGSESSAAATLFVGRQPMVSRPSNKSLRTTPSSNALTEPTEDYAESVEIPVWFHEQKHNELAIRANAIPGGIKPGDLLSLQPVGGTKKFLIAVDEDNLVNSTANEENATKETLSLHSHFQQVLDLAPRGMATLSRIDNQDLVVADTVEIFIKDVNMGRDVMWANSGYLVGKAVYQNQRLLHQNFRVGQVRYIYKNGKPMFSGYISPETNIVYRSESAKLTVLIQLSDEMWHFEENGEITFHKLVNSLFPQMFKRWRNGNTHHSITIVLFTSVDLTSIPWSSFGEGERPKDRRDYFRVVVDQVNILHWDEIMSNLRLEFANFKRDIMLNLTKDKQYVMEGEPLPTAKGNILEAINLGLSLQLDRFRNTDLKHSLNHIIVVTPSPGLFDVEYDLFKTTNDKISQTDCGIDIVSLSPPPLHLSPVFRFCSGGKVEYCIPTWCNISFYRNSEINSKQWKSRCKLYELQMMGVTETDYNNIRIERFSPKHGVPLEVAMEHYDEGAFQSVHKFQDNGKEADSTITYSTSPFARQTLALISGGKRDPDGGTISVQGAVTTAQLTVNDTNNTALSKLYTLNKSDDRNYMRRSSSATLRHFRDVFSIRRPSITGSEKSQLTPDPEVEVTPKRFPRKFKRQVRRPSDRTYLTAPTVGTVEEVSPEDTDDPMNQMWTEVKNPLVQSSQETLQVFSLSRWRDVFPPKHEKRRIKWRSFMAPAALPTSTGLFPSPVVLEHNYTFQIYNVSLNEENYWGLTNSRDLMRELIRLRLAMGFQVCYGENVNKVEADRQPGGSTEGLMKYFSDNIEAGAFIYMCYDNEIHRISLDFSGNLQVQLYSRITAKAQDAMIRLGVPPPQKYTPLIRTRYADDYVPARQDFLTDSTSSRNWNQLDQFVAGYDDMIDAQDIRPMNQMKFVVMPCEVPSNTTLLNNDHLTDEEIRVDGLRKLVAAIEKDKTKDPEILFYTGNLFDFLSQESDLGAASNKKLASKLSTSTSLVELAQELQGPNGLQLTDRKWHFKKHLRCFVGSDFVSWLVENFDDITSREDALAFGTKCMEAGMFRHVEQRHGLLDGHYFYKFEEEYVDFTRPEKPKASWFKKGTTSDVDSNLSSSVNELKPVSSVPVDSESTFGLRKRSYLLSRSVRYNVDPSHLSDRPEIITVHYDRVHNPDHCYHIRLQWLNTTAKFIDETITNWARICARHGLKLVETPWKELCQLPLESPFHSFVELKLAINPLEDAESNVILRQNPFYYHLYFLKKMDFYLDNRSTAFFSKDEHVEINYSWGVPKFQYAQFIHITGTYMVELRENGEFFMAPNNIHMIRVNSAIISSSIENKVHTRTPASIDPQKVMLKFRSACQDKEYLQQLFKEAKENWRADLSVSIV